MTILIDTNVFLWFLSNNSQLPQEFLAQITSTKNKVFISIASLWEIVLKERFGKLKLKVPVAEFIQDIEQIKPIHLVELTKLKLYHKDPFDRIIISQAKVENHKLLYTDTMINKYF